MDRGVSREQVHIAYPRGFGEPNLGGRPDWGYTPLQLRDSAGLCTGFAFEPSHPGDMAPKLVKIQLCVYFITGKSMRQDDPVISLIIA